MIQKVKEIYTYRQMLESIVLTDLRTRYKGSILGFFWTLLNPILMLMVYSVVFKYVVRIDMENYTSYLFIGLITWNVFSQSVTSGSGIINRNANLVKKIYFPKEILPLSVVIASTINFMFCLPIVIIINIYSGISMGWGVLLIPLVLLVEIVFVLAVVMTISAVNVYFRDLEHIMGVLLMVWFYLTPIVYISSMIPEAARELFNLNPLKVIVDSFHSILFYNNLPNFNQLLILSGISVLLLIMSSFIFGKLSRKFAEEI